MTRVTHQKTRQAILVTGDPLDLMGPLPDKLQLFNEAGEPLMIGGAYNRQELVFTTPILDGGQIHIDDLPLHPSVRVFKVSTNHPARVRIYATEAQRDADLLRSIGVEPAGNHGRLFELVTSLAILSYNLTPVVDLSSVDETGIFWISVTNLEDADQAIQITFNYVRTE